MLFKKSAINKINFIGLFTDLIVVFIGVYLAFLLNRFNENKKTENESIKLLTSLKIELEKIRFSFPGMADYQFDKVKEFKERLKKENPIAINTYRFIQPQYNYAVLEYAINTKDSRIVDFNLFQKLLSLYDNLKRLSFAENLINETALNYTILPETAQKSDYYQFVKANNLKTFGQFIIYSHDRASILKEAAKDAENTLEIINMEFSEDQRKKIEKELVSQHFGRGNKNFTKKDIEEIVKKFFPHFTETEIESISKLSLNK